MLSAISQGRPCSVLQCIALQCIAVYYTIKVFKVCCSALQCIAVYCSVVHCQSPLAVVRVFHKDYSQVSSADILHNEINIELTFENFSNPSGDLRPLYERLNSLPKVGGSGSNHSRMGGGAPAAGPMSDRSHYKRRQVQILKDLLCSYLTW